jgi:hypothetical protein
MISIEKEIGINETNSRINASYDVIMDSGN